MIGYVRSVLTFAIFLGLVLTVPSVLHIAISLPVVLAAAVVAGVVNWLLGIPSAQRLRRGRQQVSADPALERLSVYGGTPTGLFSALGASDGAVRWQCQIGTGTAAGPHQPPASAAGAILGAVADVMTAVGGPVHLAVSSTATVVDGAVYVGSRDSYVYALDARDGSVRWRAATGGVIRSRPAVAGGVVFVGSDDHHVYAFRTSDGALQWQYQTGGAVGSGPVVVDGAVYVGSDDHQLLALDARDGARRWSIRTGGAVQGSPAVDAGVVYAGSDDHHVYAVGAGDGALRWKYKAGGAVRTSPAVSDGLLFADAHDGTFFALDIRRGKRRWGYSTGGGAASPVVAGGVVYTGSGGLQAWDGDDGKAALAAIGQVWALRARDGHLLWRYDLGVNAAASSPAVANGVVYVGDTSGRRDYSAVYALAADTGTCLWQSPAGFAGEYPVGVTVAPGEPPPSDNPAPLRTVPLGKGR